MVVSKSDCGQSGKSVVSNDNCILSVSILLELEVVYESSIWVSSQSSEVSIRWIVRLGQIAEYVPENSNEITNGQNDNNQFESFEEIGDHQNQHPHYNETF